MAWNTIASVASHQYSHIVYAQGHQVVEFFIQSLSVASLAFTGEYGSIPHVGAHISVFVVTDIEAPVSDGHKIVILIVGICHTQCEDKYQ